MTHSEKIDRLAVALLRARRERRTLDAELFHGLVCDPTDALWVQRRVLQSMNDHQEPQPGCWKSGGPARDMLTHSLLPAAGIHFGSTTLRYSDFNMPKVEAEIAFRLGCPVTPTQAERLNDDTASSLIEAVAVSIEIVDSRWRQGLQAPALLRLSDFQSHGALVLGDWMPFTGCDWSSQYCNVQIGNHPAILRRGSHPVGNPASLLPAWLRHATSHGETIASGTVVTTGSWVGMLSVECDESITVSFQGIGMAEVAMRSCPLGLA